MRATHYRGSIDGDIKKYLKETHENGAVCSSFIGYEPFKQLWDLGVVEPGIASIRLYFPNRSDEHYIVADENNLEGVLLNAHSGQKGLHNTKELLTKTEAKYWEVDDLNPRAYRG
jgi:hypothetical protein